MSGRLPGHALWRVLTGTLLLSAFLLVNAAIVLPGIHLLWHDEHGCDEPGCVVLALAQGKLDPGQAPVGVQRPMAIAVLLRFGPVHEPLSTTDCPVLPARAPPA
jgi:hypothetical protein